MNLFIKLASSVEIRRGVELDHEARELGVLEDAGGQIVDDESLVALPGDAEEGDGLLVDG